MSGIDTFLGFPRPSGRPGIRNRLLVLNCTGLTDAAARRVAFALPGSVFASTMFGMGMVGADAGFHTAALAGMATHPNCGAVLLIGADRTRLDQMIAVVKAAGRPFVALGLDDTGHDAHLLSQRAIAEGARLRRDLSVERPVSCPVSELFLAFECGLSDPSSGLAANPLLGCIADWLVDAGGSVVLGETIEWLGTEDELARRAATPKVGEALRRAVAERLALAHAAGVDLLGTNPNAANIKAGLSTIEEKASGAVLKAGTRAIQSVLAYAEAPATAGLHFMDAPSYSPESLTGFVASGAQMILFTTGLGNSYCSALAPTLKLTANARTAGSLPHQIDFDASDVLAGRNLQDVAQDLRRCIAATASGQLTFGEILGEGAESISRFGAAI
ncbi:UxaA family hydrolase [Nitratireductor basaltis]|uniref:Altronate dehydratase n=1 Tax=Nitratireductor basaltis TaxID=472175 RepID=A0A084UET3_9HYPH|nr:UxaA family hydrolase [Nitratireductor basaltis]KFB11469.1 Altronate dehydratase [Nitratireductor basaltis]